MPKGKIDVFEERGIRYLQFGPDCIQSAMRISRPNALVLDYTRAMMAALLFQPNPRNALIIGLGAGSIVKFLHQYYPKLRITVIEIDSKVVQIAHAYFFLPEESRRLSIKIQDGFTFMQETKASFDLIIVDGFDHKSRAGSLETLPFYVACRARLCNEGIMAVNLLGQEKGFKATIERLTTAFSGQTMMLHSAKMGNVVMLCCRSDNFNLSDNIVQERIITLKQKTSLNVAFALSKKREKIAQIHSTPSS